MAISDRPLSVREDQSSSVVIHGRSVAIQYHPMSVREDQPSSFVSLHQGMRLPDKQTRYRQADKQDNKEDHKVSGFGCSEAPSVCCPSVLESTASLHRQKRRLRRHCHYQQAAAVVSLEMKMPRRQSQQPAVLAAWDSDIFSSSRTLRSFCTSHIALL